MDSEPSFTSFSDVSPFHSSKSSVLRVANQAAVSEPGILLTLSALAKRASCPKLSRHLLLSLECSSLTWVAPSPPLALCSNVTYSARATLSPYFKLEASFTLPSSGPIFARSVFPIA